VETEAAAKQEKIAERFDELARLLLEHRGEKVVIEGVMSQHLALMDALDKLGAPDGLFHPESLVGGLTKGSKAPAETIARICRRYGLDPKRKMESYGTSEVLSQMPMCAAGRYHVPPWQPVIMVDGDGETPLADHGVVEGRVALFDLLVEGRWGGFLTSDKATIDHGTCDCDRPGPTILDTVSRYEDINDDKLSCAGSIDGYMRGVIQA
jgi:hypothetical protein